MKNAAYKKIFISYRVQDTAGETGRLVDALKQHFADDQLFMDIENLEPGADFVVSIEKSLDACDVFLAVIGPHWLGERNGDTRITDPNDWVRMEVSTALQRNIRVVPVLVDGGTLPLQEQLPPELQPLLRRQAIEISNKRWQYDTNELIRFLIQKAGIQPMRATQASAAVSSVPKKRKTWVYIGAGFALAFAVLILIGLLLPNESKVKNASPETTPNTQQQDASSANASSAPEDNTGNKAADKNETAGAPANITGRWKELDEGVTSTFLLTQNGDNVNVQVELSGQIISTGTGTVQNRNVELSFPLFGMPTVLKATLSADNNMLNGSYTIQSTGDQQPIQLVRKTK